MKKSNGLFNFISLGPYIIALFAVYLFTDGQIDMGLAALSLAIAVGYYCIADAVGYTAAAINHYIVMPQKAMELIAMDSSKLPDNLPPELKAIIKDVRAMKKRVSSLDKDA